MVRQQVTLLMNKLRPRDFESLGLLFFLFYFLFLFFHDNGLIINSRRT